MRIYPSYRIFCSKECEKEYFPRWSVILVSTVVFGAWAIFLFPLIEDFLHWLRGLL